MHAPRIQLLAPLARPVAGSSTRLLLGTSELVLERVRAGYALLWSDGVDARRYVLGLEPEGQLLIALRAPALPLRVAPREVLAIVPGCRWAGYVQVPLVPTLLWQPVDESPLPLITLHPPSLTAEWDDASGHTHHCASTLHARFPPRTGNPSAVVPVRIVNRSAALLSPAAIPLTLTDDELFVRRDNVVAPPRRLEWNGTAFTGRVALAKTEVQA